jgi:hypothetical protein
MEFRYKISILFFKEVEMRYVFVAHETTLRKTGVISEPMDMATGDERLLPNGSKLFRRGTRSWGVYGYTTKEYAKDCKFVVKSLRSH